MDPKDSSLDDLFRIECEAQCRAMVDGLMAVESRPGDAALLESLMRSAHSLKGAARIVGRADTVRLAHAIEDAFVAAQSGSLLLDRSEIDRLLAGADLLARMGAGSPDSPALAAEADAFIAREQPVHEPPTTAAPDPAPAPPTSPAAKSQDDDSRVLRVSADHLDRLLGGAAESLVASRRFTTFAAGLWKTHRHQRLTALAVEEAIATHHPSPAFATALRSIQEMIEAGDRRLVAAISELDRLERGSAQLSQRLYHDALACRMRPFSELSTSLRRAARDAARSLGRDVDVEILGGATEVDRDLLEKLESPLAHIVRNAVDHGIEPPAGRVAAGKPAAGRICVEASHSAGFLVIRVSDDGAGVDLEALRRRVVERHLGDEAAAARLELNELLDFLFLPGFSMKDGVSDISGRGVGLDIVRSLAASARGQVRVHTTMGAGTTFSLQFPVSLSVMRALLFEAASEPYALPLARVECVLSLPAGKLESVNGRQFFTLGGHPVGIIDAASILGLPADSTPRENIPILVLASGTRKFGISVSRFLGEGEIVIQPLDTRLGRVRNIAAAALTEDGLPLLLVDTDDFLVSLARLSDSESLPGIVAKSRAESAATHSILVVEDSLTVRELEKKLLTSLGYHVETAVDGADGWNAARSGKFSAVVTDIDMPRMDGFELTRMIKNDPRLRDTPVIIVSYKDREEDRARGLEAGADYYLTKGSFHDEGLASAVADVLGHPHTP